MSASRQPVPTLASATCRPLNQNWVTLHSALGPQVNRENILGLGVQQLRLALEVAVDQLDSAGVVPVAGVHLAIPRACGVDGRADLRGRKKPRFLESAYHAVILKCQHRAAYVARIDQHQKRAN